MSTIPVAVQLYTLREECEKDFAGTLKKVADLGFDGVEFAGFGGLTAPEVRELLDDLGLRAAASHVPLDFAELGTGGVNIDGVLAIGEEAGVKWWVVEQDVSRRTPLESIEKSMKYLKTKFPQFS